MNGDRPDPGSPVVLAVQGLQSLLDVLSGLGYALLGPTVRGGAVVTGPIRSVDDLPRGVRDEQAPGRYRLQQHDDGAFFGFATTAQSWKPYLFPARITLWRSAPGAPDLPRPAPDPGVRQALIGVRSCDLAAIGVQDRVLLGREHVDPDYRARRDSVFVVALTCTHPGATCFCTSMGTGPSPEAGYDIALTELVDAGGHRFVATSGSRRGADVLASLDGVPAMATDVAAARQVTADAVDAMGRTVDTTDLRELLYAAADDPRWVETARRCLACGSCTMVCPTCFCVTTEDTSDLAGGFERERVWDSCFSSGHSVLHGASVRSSTAPRYRQWLTHKFAAWIDQFGTSGCVGCGRCITWCPVGIDVTEELAALRDSARDRQGALT